MNYHRHKENKTSLIYLSDKTEIVENDALTTKPYLDRFYLITDKFNQTRLIVA